MQYFNFVIWFCFRQKNKLPVLFWSGGVRKKKGRDGITTHVGLASAWGVNH